MALSISILSTVFLISTTNAIECSTNLISLDVSGDLDWASEITDFINSGGTNGIYLGASSGASSSECSVCSAAGYSLEAGLTIDTTVLKNLGLTSTTLQTLLNAIDVDLEISASLESEFCGSETLCAILSGYDLLNGVTSGCQSLSFGFDIWVPTTCNASADYNALQLYYNYGYSFACCSDADNCNENYFDDNSDQCEEVSGITSYMNGLGGCWSDIQVELATYLFCNTVGSGLTSFKDDCIDGSTGRWDDSLSDCAYKLTCNDDFLEYLATFGVCACNAANNAGYPGDLISEVLEFLWDQYCGEVNLTCTNKGDLELTLSYYYVTFELGVDGEISLWSEDAGLQGALATVLGEIGYVDTSLIDFVEFEERGDEGENTKILVQIKTNDGGVAGTIGNNMFGFSSGGDTNYGTTSFGLNFNDAVLDASVNISSEYKSSLLTATALGNYTINETSSTYDTSNIGLSASGLLSSTSWANQDAWTLATFVSGEAASIVTWIFLPMFIASIAVFYIKFKKPTMVQFC